MEPSEHEHVADTIANTIDGGTFHGLVVQGGVVHVHLSEHQAFQGPAGVPLRSVTDPMALNVRRSIATDHGDGPGLPAYVARAHDDALRAVVRRAVDGTSGTAVLVGGSSTGKTRACWEALRELPSHWRVWHPLTLRRLLAGLRTPGAIVPYTVVWLDETQSYLLQPANPLGEEAAVGLRELLAAPERGPVLVLGTLWPEYWQLLDDERHPGARALVEGRSIRVPDAFTREDLAELERVAGADPRLAEAAGRARDGEVVQYLAGAPALVERYETAPSAARALIETAMDLRRLGHGVDLPWPLLAAAAPAYLSRSRLETAAPQHWEEAAVVATRPCRGAPGPLTVVPSPHADGPLPSGQPWFRLADYLEQHGRHTRTHEVPGVGFWEAAVDHCASPDDTRALGWAALRRFRLRHADLLHRKAYEAGDRAALCGLAEIRERAGHPEEAERLAREAAGQKDMRAFKTLARMRERAGAPQEAARLYRANAEAGSRFAPWDLAWLQERNGNPSEMDRLVTRGLASGDYDVQLAVPWVRMGRDKHPLLTELVYDAAARSSVVALWAVTTAGDDADLASLEPEQPEEACRRAADAGESRPLEALAERRRADPHWARLLRYGLEPDGRTSPPWD
ncbi:tetratricopeptide repeat protein [Kitasatospora sp. NPDC057512]|uniref:tetratricopeptide repeat protein n=1 Tax=Kitasatospora sp. NPDC057512 TaxID=3346154 RepID=UPI00369E73D4